MQPVNVVPPPTTFSSLSASSANNHVDKIQLQHNATFGTQVSSTSAGTITTTGTTTITSVSSTNLSSNAGVGFGNNNTINSSTSINTTSTNNIHLNHTVASGSITKGGGGGGGGNQFVLPIPFVPEEIVQSIAQRVSVSPKPFAIQESRIRALFTKRNDQRERVSTLVEKLNQLENQKEVALSELISSRKKERDVAIAAIEEKLRSKFNEEFKRKEEQILAEVDEVCTARRKVLHDRQEIQYREENEQSQKRLKLLEAAEKASTATVVPEKRKRKGNDTSSAEAEAEGQQLLVLFDEYSNNEQVHNAKRTMDEKRLEMSELESKLNSITDTRSELIWLLKQVIKAEEKQKLNTIKVVPNPNNATGGGKDSSSNLITPRSNIQSSKQA